MHHDFRGEVIYNAETDVHFPHLTVGETLSFAAQTRAPRNRLPGVTRKQYAEHMRDVVMADSVFPTPPTPKLGTTSFEVSVAVREREFQLRKRH